MIRLIYSSALNPAYSLPELHGLLAGYRARNQRMGINSLLLLMNKDFLQLLEGEEAAVDELYEFIQRDPHHLQLTLLSRETVSKPSFANQPLIFVDTEELARKLGHPVRLSNIALHGELDHAERAKRFVHEFINGKWHHHLPNGQNPQVVHRH